MSDQNGRNLRTPFFRIKLDHTLWGRTYIYSPFTEYPHPGNSTLLFSYLTLHVPFFRRRRGNEQREVHVYDYIEGNVLENGQRVYEDMEMGGINGERNHSEHEHIAEQNQRERRESQRPVKEYEQRGGINAEENHEGNDFTEQNEKHAPGLPRTKKNKEHFNTKQALLQKQRSGGMVNKNIVDNQRRGNNHEYVNELSRENVVNEENKIVQKNSNQKLEGSYKNMSASQHQETSDGTQDAQRQSATPRNVDRRYASSNQENQMNMSGSLETRRQAVENDYYSDQEEKL